MEKEWSRWPRQTEEYQDGVNKFIESAKKIARNPDMIICPCKECKNLRQQNEEKLFEHLVIHGFDPLYKKWVLHGENSSTSVHSNDIEMSDVHRMYRNAYGQDDGVAEDIFETGGEKFKHKLKEAETPLYPGCAKYTKMSAITSLYRHKATHGLSDKGFNELLEIIQDMLPEDNTLPNSLYTTKRFLKEFDLGYEKIDACINDCCLFRKEYEPMDTCPKCGSSRWKVDERTKKVKKGVVAKVLRYFPIIPRFQRMFMSSEKAEQLMWHSTHLSQDGKMRHPVDSLAWNTINRKWPHFVSDPRNLRLGLAADGFNPFNNLSSSYSCWPVVLTVYNLPPWLCMLQENLMLTLLIPGPKQPGNDIDVYLQPLIDDLHELWTNGVEIYDASSQSNFNLKAILMWTINDFPAYGNLAGCTTKGELACPICGPNTSSQWLSKSNKTVYMDHRRFLPMKHSWRDKKKAWFDGTEEMRRPPKPLNADGILDDLKGVENDFGKGKKRKRKKVFWKKKSIFFDLSYWHELDLRHNLDVMHIEKNVCESLTATLLNIKGKSKDGLESRKDLEEIGIRKELHPQPKGNRFYLPAAPYTLSKKEKKIACERLFDLKLPDGYSSNISRCVSLEECKLVGLKSHDYHVLMQQLWSVAIRGLLPKGPRQVIFRLCSFFNELCQRVIDKSKMEKLEDDIVEILCTLERYFPPSFFDIMVHLPIHLAREARLCGPVQFRWMYPFERFMKVLKGYVRNRARPEGCIAECYLADECVRFCSMYLKKAAVIGVPQSRNEEFEDETILEGRPICKGKPLTLADDMLKIAHRYVLFNSVEVEPYIEMHLDELKRSNQSLSQDATMLQKRHIETFTSWFADKIKLHSSTTEVSTTLKWLAVEPRRYAMSYSGYIINGKRFHTSAVEKSTQDSGVFLEAETICRSSARDTTHVISNVSYYGIIRDIILLDFHKFRLPIFQCDWANIVNGVKVEDGFTLVNLHQGHNQLKRDPFILASQGKQVFYSRESKASNWYVVLKAPPRGFHELEMYEESAYRSYSPIDVSKLDKNERDKDEPYVRTDCEGIVV